MNKVAFRAGSLVSDNIQSRRLDEDDEFENSSTSSEESVHRAALFHDSKRFLVLALAFSVCGLNFLAEGCVQQIRLLVRPNNL